MIANEDGMLVSEKSIIAIWRQYRKIPLPCINWCSAIAVALAVWFFVPWSTEYSLLTAQVRALADIGLSFTTTILGFLIAGFTVFATLARPEMLIDMSQQIEKTTKLDYFRYNFFAFMGVFAEYLFACACCMLVKTLAFPGGPAGNVLAAFSAMPLEREFYVRILLGVASGGMVFLVMQLKSFVWNTFHVIVSTVSWVKYNPEK